MIRSVIPALAALATLLAGCAETARSTAPAYSRDEVRAWTKDHVVVAVSRRNTVRVNRESVKPAELPARLAALGKDAPGRPVIVLLQEGGDPRAVEFVRLHADKAGLGPVEVR